MSTPQPTIAGTLRRTVLDMNGYQWTVLLAAWLGWGFDVFDGLLFNYVAPNAVPVLLHLKLGSREAAQQTVHWAGILTSVLLLGWAVGGIVFGRIADRIGRSRTLLITIALFAFGTAACAIAPNIWVLMLCRIVASLGIGGEWAAGAAMVAEVVPEKRRVVAGALLYTSAPVGLFLATFTNYQIAKVYIPDPVISWRYVFLCGLIPAAFAFIVRLFVREPERWQSAAATEEPGRISELFTPRYRALTISGFAMALTALIAWWSTSAFIPVVARGLAAKVSADTHVPVRTLSELYVARATNFFNLGGLVGTLLTIPAAMYLGRKWMFGIYYTLSAVAIYCAFGLDLSPNVRLMMYLPIGLTVFGVFGSFTYYLPELFPTRLRGTGAGFCYNVGRVIASAGPFIIGNIASHSANVLESAMRAMSWIAVVPLLGLLAMPLVIETRDRALADT